MSNNKRKKFTISSDINSGITEVINAVNNNVGSFRYSIVALSRIEIDPDNPRELALTDKDISFGINAQDSQASRKKKEKEELVSLAHTIKNNGIINPVVVYKKDDKYRIIAGERRFLASFLAEKDDIHARIFDKKPDDIDLKLLQWIENNERQDLSLSERLKNIKSIIDAYSMANNPEKMTGEILKKLTGLSKTQAYSYLSVLKGSSDLMRAIEEGVVNNLERAVLITGITDPLLRETALRACINGESIRALKEIIATNKIEVRNNATSSLVKRRGQLSRHVELGRTSEIGPVKKIIEIIMSQPDYLKYANQFDNVNWSEHKQVSLIFQKLLSILKEDLKSYG